MSRLSDLYKAMETLRKEGLSLNEELEKQVSDLEEKRDIERIANVFGIKIKVEIV